MDEVEQVKKTVGFSLPHEETSLVAIDLNRRLIAHPHATFLFRMTGNAMQAEGIFDGDIIIVDRAMVPQNGQLVLAVVDNSYLVRRIRIQDNQTQLLLPDSENKVLNVGETQNITIWGVVRSVIKEFVKP